MSSPGRHLLLLAALFATTFAAAAAFFLSMPVIEDADSYFHLAVAREYGRHGMLHDFPWARLSLLRERFGDKELLFHLALVPFVDESADSTGGRVALALLNAIAATLLGHLAIQRVGPWGLALPLVLALSAPDLLSRLARVRPEIAALILLLLATDAAARGRARWLGFLGILFPLTYIAWQSLAGLVVLWFLERWWSRGELAWDALLYPLAGIGLGLILHPQFPGNLDVWAAVFFAYHRTMSELPATNEIFPATTARVLFGNAGVWIAAGAAILAPRGAPAPPNRLGSTGRLAPWVVAAACFALLHAASWRFGIYFYPFAAIALASWCARRGLPSWGAGKSAAVVAVALAASSPATRAFARDFLRDASDTRERRGRELGAAIPAGARVAAPWDVAEAYFFFAPHATYLNFLDPLLMAVPYPVEHRFQRGVFDGTEVDVPLVVGTMLDSDHLAFASDQSPRLAVRCRWDPRLAPLVVGADCVYQLRSDGNGAFWLDWEIAPAPDPPWSTPPAPLETPVPYERARGRAHELEGFVEGARRLPPGKSGVFTRRLDAPRGVRRRVELVGSGPAALWVDGRHVATVAGAGGAVLGEGTILDLDLAPGEHTIQVATAPGPGGRMGFYLVDR